MCRIWVRCRMSAITGKKFMLGFILWTWLSFWVYLLYGCNQGCHWVELQIAGAELIGGCRCLTGYLPLTAQCFPHEPLPRQTQPLRVSITVTAGAGVITLPLGKASSYVLTSICRFLLWHWHNKGFEKNLTVPGFEVNGLLLKMLSTNITSYFIT